MGPEVLIALLCSAAAGIVALILSAQTVVKHLRHLADTVRQGTDSGFARAVETVDSLRAETKNVAAQALAAIGEMQHQYSALTASADRLARAFTTLDQDGKLSEWVDVFREAIGPLQRSAAEVEQNHGLMRQMLATTAQLLQDWTAQREQIQQALVRLSDMMERSLSEEATHARDIEHRIMARLEEVQRSDQLVASTVSKLEIVRTRYDDLVEQVRENIRKSDGVLEKAGPIYEGLRELVARHGEVVTAMRGVASDLGGTLTGLNTSLHQVPREVAAEVNAHLSQIVPVIQGVSAEVRRMQEAHGAALEHLGSGIKGMLDRQNEAAESAREALQAALASQQQGPTRENQKVLVGLLVVQCILLLGVIVCVLIHKG
jgi:uncharacterized protein YoxC